MHNQIKLMLQMQDEMNSKVTEDWLTRGFEWYRAIWIECGELMDHHGWKWWKKQDPDIEQVKLEVIDIWHFGLSMLLESSEDHDQLIDSIADDFNYTAASAVPLLDAVETFATTTLAERSFSPSQFKSLMDAAGMSFDDLYIGYVGKNTLNLFRQDHGYKEGTYKKVWDGREDNEHLVDAADMLDTSSLDFKNDLYGFLKMRYSNVNH